MFRKRPQVMENKPTITIALPSLIPVGGVERNSLLLTEQFLRKGYEVDIVIADERNDTTDVIPSAAKTIIFGKPRIRQFVRPFANYLNERKPDAIICSMWPFTSACIAAHRISRSKSKILVSDHNPLSVQYKTSGRLHNLMMRLSLATTYRLADIRLGVSAGVADDVARLSSIARIKFEVIYNPIQLPQNERFNAVPKEVGNRCIKLAVSTARQTFGYFPATFQWKSLQQRGEFTSAFTRVSLKIPKTRQCSH